MNVIDDYGVNNSCGHPSEDYTAGRPTQAENIMHAFSTCIHVKAYYFMKVGLVDLSTMVGKSNLNF